MIFFVPARKGSQRVNGKNIRPICGKPLVEWTFDAIDDVRGHGDEVVVSSDDAAVLNRAHARGYDARQRPADFCGSTAKMSDVLDISFRHDHRDGPVCVLYPTSPMRTAAHIRAAASVWKNQGRADRVLMSVCPVYHRPYGLLGINHQGMLEFRRPDGRDFYQQQNMPVDFRANGAIYIIPLVLIRTQGIDAQLFGPATVPFVMTEEESLEVDTEQDFQIIEFLLARARAHAHTGVPA